MQREIFLLDVDQPFQFYFPIRIMARHHQNMQWARPTLNIPESSPIIPAVCLMYINYADFFAV